MQNLVLNRSRLTELFRCDRSFVLSLFHHGLDNDSLKGIGYDVDSNEIENTRQGIMLDMAHMREAIDAAGGYTTVECSSSDPWEKVTNTMNLINQGGPLVIIDGALANNDCIVGFAALIVREDGYWEVFHLSAKSYEAGSDMSTTGKSYAAAYADATPLMYVLADQYSDYVARFAVIAANKKYLTPYPDPETGMITVDPDAAMFCVDMELGDDLWAELGNSNPLSHVETIYSMVSQDPFWIPDAYMGPHCNKPYTCPYTTYCRNRMDPDSIDFHIDDYRDRHALAANGYFLMADVLELSYEYPTLENIPCLDGNGVFSLGDSTLRCLRLYESQL